MSLNRSISRNYMPERIREGWSFNQFYTWRVDQGTGYNRNQALLDWRVMGERVVKEGKVRFLNYDSYPGDKTLIYTHFGQDDKYWYTVKGWYNDKDTGDIHWDYFTIKSSSALTRGEIESEAWMNIGFSGGRYDVEFRSFQAWSARAPAAAL